MINLNINYLNCPTEKQRLTDWISKTGFIFLLYLRNIISESKDGKEYCKQMVPRIKLMQSSDKRDFKPKAIIREEVLIET